MTPIIYHISSGKAIKMDYLRERVEIWKESGYNSINNIVGIPQEYARKELEELLKG